jgi:hypothetical protein
MSESRHRHHLLYCTIARFSCYNKSKLTVVETLLATMPPSNYKITLAQLRLAAVCNRTLIARSGSNCCFFSCCGGHCAWRHDAECRLSTPSVSFTMYAKAHIQKIPVIFLWSCKQRRYKKRTVDPCQPALEKLIDSMEPGEMTNKQANCVFSSS